MDQRLKCLRKVLRKQSTLPQLTNFLLLRSTSVISSALSVTELFKVKNNEVMGQASLQQRRLMKEWNRHLHSARKLTSCPYSCLKLLTGYQVSDLLCILQICCIRILVLGYLSHSYGSSLCLPDRKCIGKTQTQRGCSGSDFDLFTHETRIVLWICRPVRPCIIL